MRDRLIRDNGTADNQVVQIYGLDTPAGVVAQIDGNCSPTDEWLDNIASDALTRTPEEVIAAKPGHTQDTCWDGAGNAIVEPASYDGDTACNALVPVVRRSPARSRSAAQRRRAGMHPRSTRPQRLHRHVHRRPMGNTASGVPRWGV